MTSRIKISTLLACAIVVCLSFTSCLGGSDSETIITNWQNATIKSFSFEDNSDVCSSLSSYSFTIDNFGTSDPELSSKMPNSGIIFNPDSLPVGTIPDSITVKIDLNNASSAIFSQFDETGVLQKTTNFNDTQYVFFNKYAVTRLDVVSHDASVKKSYFIKVNVHKVYGDTIRWQYLTDFSTQTDKIAQKVVAYKGSVIWFEEQTDGSQYASTSTLDNLNEWLSTTCMNAEQKLEISSIVNWKDKLYAVDKGGALLSSDSPLTKWDICNDSHKFVSILGVQLGTKKYDEHLQAIVSDGGTYKFARSFDGVIWEVLGGLPEGFPIKNFSNPISNEANTAAGNVTSRLYIVGGETAEGKLISSTWSCDGNSWAEFPQSSLPAMTRAAIVQYTLDVDKPGSLWILWPGVLADGSVKNTPYFSENKGVTWKLLNQEYASYAVTSPIKAVGGVSPVMDEKNYWMYFFGGVDSNGRQQTNVFGGQLLRLTFNKIK